LYAYWADEEPFIVEYDPSIEIPLIASLQDIYHLFFKLLSFLQIFHKNWTI
jgi:hypothetical protein